MSNEKTGGPAFPFGTAYSGMTLRDYFAAKAMQGELAHSFWSEFDYLARQAYQIADAMLEAREE